MGPAREKGPVEPGIVHQRIATLSKPQRLIFRGIDLLPQFSQGVYAGVTSPKEDTLAEIHFFSAAFLAAGGGSEDIKQAMMQIRVGFLQLIQNDDTLWVNQDRASKGASHFVSGHPRGRTEQRLHIVRGLILIHPQN